MEGIYKSTSSIPHHVERAMVVVHNPANGLSYVSEHRSHSLNKPIDEAIQKGWLVMYFMIESPPPRIALITENGVIFDSRVCKFPMKVKKRGVKEQWFASWKEFDRSFYIKDDYISAIPVRWEEYFTFKGYGKVQHLSGAIVFTPNAQELMTAVTNQFIIEDYVKMYGGWKLLVGDENKGRFYLYAVSEMMVNRLQELLPYQVLDAREVEPDKQYILTKRQQARQFTLKFGNRVITLFSDDKDKAHGLISRLVQNNKAVSEHVGWEIKVFEMESPTNSITLYTGSDDEAKELIRLLGSNQVSAVKNKIEETSYERHFTSPIGLFVPDIIPKYAGYDSTISSDNTDIPEEDLVPGDMFTNWEKYK